MERQEKTQPQADLTPTIPPRVKDLTGQRFGRWTVLQFYDGTRQTNLRQAVWMCRCDCGTVKPVKSQSLTRGVSKSCGCGRGRNGNVTPRKDKPVELIQRATTAPVDERQRASLERSRIDYHQTATLQSSQGYAWRKDNTASPLNNKKLEQHPDGLWKYPGSYVSPFTPLPPHLMPRDYQPNFKRIHSNTNNSH